MSEVELWIFIDRFNGLFAIPFALVGFIIALGQLKKTRHATEAVSDTAAKAVRSLQQASSLTLTIKMTALESELINATVNGETALFVNLCSQWKANAGQLKQVLSARDGDEYKELMRKLQDSIATAGIASNSIVTNGSDVDLRSEGSYFMKVVQDVTGSFGSLGQNVVEGILTNE
ncbi:hypothetical protein GM708_07610 [Vibrio cholerae]|nr:hypothetical protein [Vibrio cholerae]